MVRRLALALVLTFALPRPAAPADAGGFVVRVGRDTIGIERYRRTATRLEIEHVARANRVLRHHVTCDLAGGMVTHAAAVVTAPGDTAPVQAFEATFRDDSAHVRSREGTMVVAVPRDAIVAWYTSYWPPYEIAIARLLRGKADSLRVPMYLLGGRATLWVSLHRLGRDSVDLVNWHKEHYHARIDGEGHVLGAVPISGPNKFIVDRVRDADVDGAAASWVARERAGGGLGALSPRDTLRASVAGASIWIDYGRPGKRGRAIFGGLVPYGEIWRTGANAATQLRTDRPLDFGGTVVPAGSYSLWTLPRATGWTLIVNGETGQWGTAHDATKDLYRIEMNVTTLASPVERFTIGVEPAPRGGALTLDWDTTRASAAFTVPPDTPAPHR